MLDPRARRLLILGGTAEAAALAAAAIERFGDRLEVISSFAGRVDGIRPPPGRIRIGGFGGPQGLAHYLKSEAIDLVVDATHPFAREISLNVRLAAEQTGGRRLVLWRPPWPRHPLDRWIEVDGIDGAARALRHLGRRVWLTVGAGELQPFADLDDRWFLVRLVEARGALPLADHTLIEGRGPFPLEAERALIRQHRIDVLVTKASGGAATYAKIEAAREADLPVVMVRRPLPEPGERVDSIDAALDWISTYL
jgi:precorrin-6A/cobalt-precorrin-6A reductase